MLDYDSGYKPKNDANGSFAIAGACFFAILYYVVFALGEVPATVQGRSLLLKHRTLGFYHPSAYTLAQLTTDLPVYFLQTLVFASCFYFMVGLNSGAKYFFTFWFTVFTLYICLSCMYRMIGSWTVGLSVAIRYGALALAIVLSSAGFTVPPPRQREFLHLSLQNNFTDLPCCFRTVGWISWLRRASPASWAFESLMANEFRVRTLTCSESQMIPGGPEYTNVDYQTCSIVGAEPGTVDVPGADYIKAVYGFESKNIWRNVGILWAFIVIYILGIFIGSSLLVRDSPGQAGRAYIDRHPAPKKEQDVNNEKSTDDDNVHKQKDLSKAPIYTFEDIKYTVKVDGNKDKVLLVSEAPAKD